MAERMTRAEVEAARDRAKAAQQDATTEGWWCPGCLRAVPGIQVTFFETHEVCGSPVGAPPPVESPLFADAIALADLALAQMEEIERLRGALGALLESPYVIDPATVPKAGIEANPEQVVGTLHVAYVKHSAACNVMRLR